jgi:hypothetical protein
MAEGEAISRVFKTRWFSKAAKKALIHDEALCEALAEVMNGQADDLGGGVFKKRLNRNMHRSIVLARGGKMWVYAYLFAKKDRQNIDEDELQAFRKLAGLYSLKSDDDLNKEIAAKELVEICHGQEAKI